MQLGLSFQLLSSLMSHNNTQKTGVLWPQFRKHRLLKYDILHLSLNLLYLLKIQLSFENTDKIFSFCWRQRSTVSLHYNSTLQTKKGLVIVIIVIKKKIIRMIMRKILDTYFYNSININTAEKCIGKVILGKITLHLTLSSLEKTVTQAKCYAGSDCLV